MTFSRTWRVAAAVGVAERSESGPPLVTLRCSVVDEVAKATPSDHVPLNGGAPVNVATAFAEAPAQRPFGARD